jgi:hypothetical protein
MVQDGIPAVNVCRSVYLFYYFFYFYLLTKQFIIPVTEKIKAGHIYVFSISFLTGQLMIKEKHKLTNPPYSPFNKGEIRGI